MICAPSALPPPCPPVGCGGGTARWDTVEGKTPDQRTSQVHSVCHSRWRGAALRHFSGERESAESGARRRCGTSRSLSRCLDSFYKSQTFYAVPGVRLCFVRFTWKSMSRPVTGPFRIATQSEKIKHNHLPWVACVWLDVFVYTCGSVFLSLFRIHCIFPSALFRIVDLSRHVTTDARLCSAPFRA